MAEQERVAVVVYRTATGRTIYRQVPGTVADVDVASLIKGDSGRRVLRGDGVRAAEVKDMTPEQYEAIADANPTWIEVRDAPDP